MINVKFCNKCGLTKPVEEFHKNKNSTTGFQTYCKECRGITYHTSDKSMKKEYDSKRYFDNREERSIWRKEYHNKNKEYFNILSNIYYVNNREKIILYNNSSAKYDLYFDKLTIDESPRLSIDGISLEVRCRYCGKYFKPTNNEVRNRIGALYGHLDGGRSLYCSTGCKTSCPIYHKAKYPGTFKKITAREVDPILRQMCFARDNWQCQICGKEVEEVTLHCHHIEGYTQNPLLGNDIDNVITLCKSHHKEVHKLPGCGYYELQCVGELS